MNWAGMELLAGRRRERLNPVLDVDLSPELLAAALAYVMAFTYELYDTKILYDLLLRVQ